MHNSLLWFNSIRNVVPADTLELSQAATSTGVTIQWAAASSLEAGGGRGGAEGKFHTWLGFHCLHKQTCGASLLSTANMADIQNDLALLFSAAISSCPVRPGARSPSAEGGTFRN